MAWTFLVTVGLRDLDKYFMFCFLVYLLCYNHSDSRTCENRTSLVSLGDRAEEGYCNKNSSVATTWSSEMKIKMAKENYHPLFYSLIVTGCSGL